MIKGFFRCPLDVTGRIDKVLADQFPEVSRTWIRTAIEEGRIPRSDGSKLEPKTKVFPDDELMVDLERPSCSPIEPYDYPLKILHEDDHLIVVNKDSGMVTHPGDGTSADTLVHALMHHCPDQLCPIGAPERPGIVHRLDKETSGVMVIAKSEQAYHSLVSQFSDRKTQKKYFALVSGQLSGAEGEFNGAIARHPKVRVKMTVAEHGKPALTTWRLIKRFEEGFSFIDCEIKTGRTHQIRVHFSNASNPIAGDLTYGFKQNGKSPVFFSRVMLHACELSFNCPRSSERLTFRAEIPDDLELALQKLTPTE